MYLKPTSRSLVSNCMSWESLEQVSDWTFEPTISIFGSTISTFGSTWSWITCNLYKHLKIISHLITWVVNHQSTSDLRANIWYIFVEHFKIISPLTTWVVIIKLQVIELMGQHCLQGSAIMDEGQDFSLQKLKLIMDNDSTVARSINTGCGHGWSRVHKKTYGCDQISSQWEERIEKVTTMMVTKMWIVEENCLRFEELRDLQGKLNVLEEEMQF